MLELNIFDYKIRFSVKFPPRDLIRRSQFWNLGPKIKENAERLAKIHVWESDATVWHIHLGRIIAH